MSLALRASDSGAVGVGGGCTLRVGPQGAHETWKINTISVSNTSDPSLSRANPITVAVYRNFASPSSLLGGTYNGIGDTSTGENISLSSGESLIVVWTDADVGSVCVVNVEGSMELKGAQVY